MSLLPHQLELLAPARDADIGIEAVNHGADAVYIGGPSFGARTSADNTRAGHRAAGEARAPLQQRASSSRSTPSCATTNWKPARKLAWQLYDAGVDALIIQDMGLLETRPAADPAARQHPDRHPHAGEGALPAGRGPVADRAGARTDAGADRRHPRRDRPGALHAGVLHPRRAVRGLQRPVLHQPRPHRAQRQPRRLLAGLPPALPGDRRQGRIVAHDKHVLSHEGQQPERQPARADRRRHPQLQDRGALQGHGLREEHHGPLPHAARRHPGSSAPNWRARPAAAAPSPSRPTRTRTSTASSPTTSCRAARTTSAPSTRPRTRARPIG